MLSLWRGKEFFYKKKKDFDFDVVVKIFKTFGIDLSVVFYRHKRDKIQSNFLDLIGKRVFFLIIRN